MDKQRLNGRKYMRIKPPGRSMASLTRAQLIELSARLWRGWERRRQDYCGGTAWGKIFLPPRVPV